MEYERLSKSVLSKETIYDGMPIGELLSLVTSVMDEHPDAAVEDIGSYDYSEFRISWMEPESDEEYKIRTDRIREREKKERAKNDARDRKEYERLKKKFGPKNDLE